ncbi:MAG: hypothetical protein JW891_12600 [Candidatus Lokiarchaeota archaeon]|nr:hypothetical protein [Candidatus Lokiarchaeota archaeon]
MYSLYEGCSFSCRKRGESGFYLGKIMEQAIQYTSIPVKTIDPTSS